MERLRKNPSQIQSAWDTPNSHPSGCLFLYASSTGLQMSNEAVDSGCLTMIRSNSYHQVLGRPDLTTKIACDVNIPEDVNDIQVKHLKHFARWQRILDKELNRQ